MTLFILTNASGAGAGSIAPGQAQLDLAVISNGDPQLGFNATPPNLQQVTYNQTTVGPPPNRLNALVNTNFNVNPQNIDIIILAVGGNFVLNDGRLISNIAGTAMAPAGSGGPSAASNPTTACLVVYDTSQSNGDGYCVARAGTGGILDLPFPNAAILYHELSHAFRIVTGALNALTPGCNPSSPEERAAIVDENDVRTQMAAAAGNATVLRDPGIHCGQACSATGTPPPNCCIVATVASGSHLSVEVGALRAIRDDHLRATEAGYAFFQALHHAYYGFSPEVVRLMAVSPGLRELVRTSYVQPLVVTLQVIERFCLEGTRGNELGETFNERREAVGCPQLTAHEIERALALLQGDVRRLSPTPNPAESELAQILLEHAVPDPYVQWGLIQPIRIYLHAMRVARTGRSTSELGRFLEAQVKEWSSQLPIADFWASLTKPQVDAELSFLRQTLLVSPVTFDGFVARLKQTFPSSQAIQAAATIRSLEEVTDE